MKKSDSLMVLFILMCRMNIFLSMLPTIRDQRGSGGGEGPVVDAMDSAFARVMESGRFREIINSDPVAGPLMVNIGDCYPRIVESGVEIYPFPQNPTGLLKYIRQQKY